MSGSPPTAESRQESFPVDATKVELDVQLGSGAVTIELVDGIQVVEVTVSAGQGSWWQQGLSGVMSMLGATDPAGSGPVDLAGDALRATDIAFSPQRGRVSVRAPRSATSRAVALNLHLRAPRAAQVFVRTSTAPVAVTGLAQRVDISTGSGEVSVADVADGTDVRAGSAGIRLGALAGRARARTGSGDITVDSAAGDLELISGTGDLRIGIGAGVTAELDLSSGAGTMRSELPLLDTAPSDSTAPTTGSAHVRARSGSGSVLVHGTR